MILPRFAVYSITFLVLAATPLRAENPCTKFKAAWEKIQSYQCTYRALTSHEGKVKETVMRYSYRKPGKIRMDIQKPQKGAALLYDPGISPKVKVRPFPRLARLILNYNLTDKRVSSDSGGTIDRSDLGHRMEEICRDPENKKRKLVLDRAGFLRIAEFFDAQGNRVESFEWQDLIVDPTLPKDLFQKF